MSALLERVPGGGPSLGDGGDWWGYVLRETDQTPRLQRTARWYRAVEQDPASAREECLADMRGYPL